MRPAIHSLRTHRSGMATLTAMAMIGLMAAAMLAMVQGLKVEAETVRTASTDAQLRQLLQIGARSARPLVPDNAANGNRPLAARNWNVALPPDLENRGGMISLRAQPGRTKFEHFVRVEVRLDGRDAKQTLRYITADQKLWTLVEADLGD